jgi:hypothetical protein
MERRTNVRSEGRSYRTMTDVWNEGRMYRMKDGCMGEDRMYEMKDRCMYEMKNGRTDVSLYTWMYIAGHTAEDRKGH